MQFCVRNPFFLRVALVALLDFGVLLTSFALAFLTVPAPSVTKACALSLVMAVTAMLALQVTGAYGLDTVTSARKTNLSLLAAMGIGFVGALLAQFLIPLEPVIKDVSLRAAAIFMPLFIIERKAFRSASKRIRRRILLLGSSELASDLVGLVEQRSALGLEVVGLLSGDEDDPWEIPREGVPFLGPFHHLEKLMDDERRVADWVVVASRGRHEPLPTDQLLHLKMRGIPICSGISLYERMTGELYLRDLRSTVLIFDQALGMGRVQLALKRLLDLAIACAALMICAPVLLAAAIAIRLDSKGPIFFRQIREGRLGRQFRVVKLRTMKDSAEADTGPVYSSREDDRITRVGRFLRRTRIDELPQFWNVLKGEMSVVGPRPERPEFMEDIKRHCPYFPLRTACKPGVTGWAQVRYGYVSDFEGSGRKLALDLFYIRNASLAMDFWILWATVRTVFLLRGV